MLHAAFVRSPHAHAAIAGATVPELGPGIAVLRAADLGELRPFPVMRAAGSEILETEAHPVLAGDEVRYAGQPVALVLASSRAAAEDVAELVEVEYEPRPAELDPRTASVTMMRWACRGGD